MTYTQDQIDAIHELPLLRDVRWIDLSAMFPGHVIEEMKREPGDEASGKWAGVNLGCSDCAAKVVATHNEWLAAQAAAEAEAKQSADDADERR